MTIREILQIELWSKETSQRIIRRTWKVVKPVGAVSAILVLLTAILYVVESSWLTGAERKVGRIALDKIEALEQLERSSGEGFDVMNSEAKNSTAIAQERALTLRDRRTALLLEFYRWELETNHENRLREMRARAILAARHSSWPAHPDFERKKSETQLQIYNLMRDSLHKALD